jgi:cytoskeletal protein CcmA (bactofilin family)
LRLRIGNKIAHLRAYSLLVLLNVERKQKTMAGPEDATESRVGKGTKISGKLNFRGPAKIEGEAEGEITGEEVVIASGAVVSARISATRVTIAGVFSGEVTARERVELLATARAQCTINTPSLVLNEGATFDGDCRMPRNKIAA